MAEQRIGVVYNIPPEPPKESDTTWLPAGAVTIGIEYRTLDPESLVELYRDNPDHLAEMLAKSPDGGFADSGVSLHVKGTDDGHEYLRFDVFDGEPHYHYVYAGPEIVNNVVVFDTFAHGDMLPFALACLRTRLSEMLTRAGGAHVAAALDPAVLEPVVDEVERRATAVLGRTVSAG
jgi:hypothetical protein